MSEPLIKTPIGWRRILLNGAPFSGKTNGLLTFPPPRYVMVSPGEMGMSTLPEGDPDTTIYQPPVPAPNEIGKMVTDFKQHAKDVIAGKFGKIRTLCIEALHLYAEWHMKALGWTITTLEDKEGPREYPKYYHEIMQFLKQLAEPSNGLDFFVATCYDGREQTEDATGEKVKGQMSVWPEMPGKLAKLVMGSFPCVFHTERLPGNPVDTFYWRLRPIGQMQAAGLHIPARLAAKLPPRIEVKVNLATGAVEGGWQTLERLIAEATNVTK